MVWELVLNDTQQDTREVKEERNIVLCGGVLVGVQETKMMGWVDLKLEE